MWENVYDWHVRHQQPIAATRTADGRYVMTVMFTTLILRPDQVNGYIGYGFDARWTITPTNHGGTESRRTYNVSLRVSESPWLVSAKTLRVTSPPRTARR